MQARIQFRGRSQFFLATSNKAQASYYKFSKQATSYLLPTVVNSAKLKQECFGITELQKELKHTQKI